MLLAFFFSSLNKAILWKSNTRLIEHFHLKHKIYSPKLRDDSRMKNQNSMLCKISMKQTISIINILQGSKKYRSTYMKTPEQTS